MVGEYYQAQVVRQETLFFVATLRKHEHVAFDRTLDKEKGIFEFFVPQSQEPRFLKIMQQYLDLGIIFNLQKLPNRLAQPGEEL